MTHHFVMTSSLRIKNFKIDKFGDFSSEIGFNNTKMDIFRDVISLIGDRREPPADTKYPPAAQRKQAKRACKRITQEGFETSQIAGLGSSILQIFHIYAPTYYSKRAKERNISFN